MKIALLGAESTGKTQLAGELAAHFRAAGRTVAVVSEVLREWCANAQRTPRPEEQLPIAQEQERRVDAAAAGADIVIADTTAMMVAIYSAMLFEDGSLYRFALERQRGYDVTLVTGLDLPWVADGLQRDGPHVREPVDALVRAGLTRAGVAYRVVYGQGPERLDHALAAIHSIAPHSQLAGATATFDPKPVVWRWSCEKCGDAACEHRLFTGLGRDPADTRALPSTLHSRGAPMSPAQATFPDRNPLPIEQARDMAGEVRQDLEVASAELHLTNIALEQHLPDQPLHGDVERALAQNVAVETKVQDAAKDLEAVTVLLGKETAERERLERELAAATRTTPD